MLPQNASNFLASLGLHGLGGLMPIMGGQQAGGQPGSGRSKPRSRTKHALYKVMGSAAVL